VLGIPRIVAANFHASLLPAYRGKHPVFWALRHGERSAGLTVHVMDPHIDTGDVLYRTKVRTRRRDSVATLYSRIMDRSVALVPRLVEDAVAGRLRPEKQGAEGASYYSSTTAEDFRLDWTSDRRALLRWIRATPSKCWFSLRGRTVYVQDATIPLGAPPESIGTIMRLGRGGCTVAVGGGALRLRSGCLDDGPIEHMSVVCAKLGLAVGDSLG